MRNLIGMEMVCFGKTEQLELTYEGGGYIDAKGDPVPDVMDMNCYICSSSFYTREGDYIGYCPNCGHVNRKRFGTREQLVDYVREHDWSWLRANGMKLCTVQVPEGDWQIRFARDPDELTRSGRYLQVRTV